MAKRNVTTCDVCEKEMGRGFTVSADYSSMVSDPRSRDVCSLDCIIVWAQQEKDMKAQERRERLERLQAAVIATEVSV